MQRAQNNKHAADWLVANATSVEDDEFAEHDSELDSELGSDVDMGGSESEPENEGSAFVREWSAVSKVTNVPLGKHRALAEFTFDPEIAKEFWR
jgi:hypothetical protein